MLLYTGWGIPSRSLGDLTHRYPASRRFCRGNQVHRVTNRGQSNRGKLVFYGFSCFIICGHPILRSHRKVLAVQKTTAPKGKDRRSLSCPRCGATGSLSGRDDYYGSYLGCLTCGWHGEADEDGIPIMVVIPPPPIRRRRRRKKVLPGLSGGVDGDSPGDLVEAVEPESDSRAV